MLVIAVGIGALSGYLLEIAGGAKGKNGGATCGAQTARERASRSLVSTLVKQDETERRLLAADLHDQVLNDLKALKTKIDKFGKTGDSELPGQDLCRR